MGKIDSAVQNEFLKKNPLLHDILNPFLSDFDVNWGAERFLFNTKLYTFIIKPTENFMETFGLEYELLMVYTPFETMQARTMQAIHSLFLSEPAKGRVENLVCIIVSNMPDAKDWVSTYTIENQDLRTYVIFNKETLLKHSSFSLINEFRMQLSERDLFDVQLPLLDDMYFFGRDTILQTVHNNIRQCENSGIFGLRKTGKTSFLYKIKRTIENANVGKVFIYDVKNAKIRMRNWTTLLGFILNEISMAYGLSSGELDADPIRTVEAFEKVLSIIPNGQKIVIIVDEIEYISFAPPLDRHWETDYFNFWQTLWSMQSQFRNICFVIAGVNPQVMEESTVKAVQNPLFGIIKPYYIQGLEKNDIHSMARRIGRRLGLKFDHTAIDYIYLRYGGHPLLTRLASSFENRNAPCKPITFDRSILIKNESSRENELIPYCQHIVDVLRDFYPDEHMLLQFLSIGATQDFMDLSTSPLIVSHLINYGLLEYKNGIPQISISVVANYISNEYAKEQGTLLAHPVIPKEQRNSWLKDNIKSIISYIRQLEAVIRTKSLPLLFGSNSFPEAEKLLEIPIAISENTFKAFISTLSNCFVESITNYGKSISNSNYFWGDIKSNYPALFDALLRIKAYRNKYEHLTLNQQMQEIVNNFLRNDLEGKEYNDVPEIYFILQQRTVEELKIAISVEISRLS